MNTNLVLLSGFSATGKSMALRGLENPEKVLYLNAESNKALPFKAGQQFISRTITDPMTVFGYLEQAIAKPDKIETVVFDSLSFLMNMYESVYVLTSSNTQKAWGDYSQYFQNMMSQYIARMPQKIVFIAHTSDVIAEDKVARVAVKVKGSLMNVGIESFFDKVISAKRMPIKKLQEYANPLLNITPREEALGYKYVFQTQITKETVNESIRGPYDMWTPEETYIDNNMQLVFNRFKEYYGK